MAECLRGNPYPTPKLGPLLIDENYVAAIEKLVEYASQASTDLQAQHGIEVSFDDAATGVAALDQIIARVRARNWPADSNPFKWHANALGSVLACMMLQRGNSITAFRAKDNFTNFSVYVPDTKVEYFPFHKIQKCLSTPDTGTVVAYYAEFDGDM
ncbi:MAG TPA: hypothetical protein VHX44_17275 [Planctomycetota bacterium]|nr:hypothetical protein [Planctomycetota bacterium]